MLDSATAAGPSPATSVGPFTAFMARLNPPSTFAAAQRQANMPSTDSLPDWQCQPCLRSNSPASSSASKPLARRHRTPNFERWQIDREILCMSCPSARRQQSTKRSGSFFEDARKGGGARRVRPPGKKLRTFSNCATHGYYSCRWLQHKCPAFRLVSHTAVIPRNCSGFWWKNRPIVAQLQQRLLCFNGGGKRLGANSAGPRCTDPPGCPRDA